MILITSDIQTFHFHHCIVYPSLIYDFWLYLCYFQIFLKDKKPTNCAKKKSYVIFDLINYFRKIN